MSNVYREASERADQLSAGLYLAVQAMVEFAKQYPELAKAQQNVLGEASDRLIDLMMKLHEREAAE